jgi:hypothetical protein
MIALRRIRHGTQCPQRSGGNPFQRALVMDEHDIVSDKYRRKKRLFAHADSISLLVRKR